MMEGYKVFKPDWTCRGFQYEVGKTFEEDVTPSCCDRGFHFCKKLNDCFKYYKFDPENKVAKVIALGEIDESSDDSKCCTNKIKIVEEISWEDICEMVNTGKSNLGRYNTGQNNFGDFNSGMLNRGFCNSGEFNIGNSNTGRHNNGYKNTGNYNNGDCNTGNYNTGNYNTGEWNKTNRANGCFNTKNPTLYFFNKPSKWTYEKWLISHQRNLLQDMPRKNDFVWTPSCVMTDEEKELHSEYKITRGYFRVVDNIKCRQGWWDELREIDKNSIKSLPNFDKDIFEEITGIKI